MKIDGNRDHLKNLKERVAAKPPVFYHIGILKHPVDRFFK